MTSVRQELGEVLTRPSVNLDFGLRSTAAGEHREYIVGFKFNVIQSTENRLW